MQEIITHLSKDPIMKSLIDQHGLKVREGDRNHFMDLVEIITSQQLAVKAADTIYARLLNLLGNKEEAGIVPQNILDLSHEEIRSAGYSNSKATYIRNVAEAFQNEQIKPDQFQSLSDQEVTDLITSIKGLGPWSAEMFLMFSLNRPDIFSIGDLGLRQAISNLYGVDREDHASILKLSESWKPYRTHASRLLWASLDNSPGK